MLEAFSFDNIGAREGSKFGSGLGILFLSRIQKFSTASTFHLTFVSGSFKRRLVSYFSNASLA